MSLQIDPAASIIASQSSTSLVSDAVQQSVTRKSAPIDPAPSISESESSISISSDFSVQLVTGVPYSARVGDTTYSTQVQPVGNLYEGTIPNLPGASTIGATVEQVENRLGNLISFFA